MKLDETTLEQMRTRHQELIFSEKEAYELLKQNEAAMNATPEGRKYNDALLAWHSLKTELDAVGSFVK